MQGNFTSDVRRSTECVADLLVVEEEPMWMIPLADTGPAASPDSTRSTAQRHQAIRHTTLLARDLCTPDAHATAGKFQPWTVHLCRIGRCSRGCSSLGNGMAL